MEKSVQFQSFDGTALDGTFRSGARGEKAVALFVHGITSSRDEFGLFSGLAERLATDGVGSFRFEYRCHGKKKMPMESLILSGIVNDIEAAAKVGAAEGKASEVHIVGMSFGGGVSAYWAATTSMKVKSVVMLAPVIDYEQDVLGQHGAIDEGQLSDSAARKLKKHGYVEMDGVRYGGAMINELRLISGAEGLRQLRCKALILHGDADSIVPFASSERYAKMYENCQLINIPGTDHGFGVGDDEDLSSPETKEKHREVWDLIASFIAKAKR